MKNLISFIISCIFFISVTNAQPVWQWQNPVPSGSWYFSGCFLDHNTGWIIGEGTVSKTTNNGLSWNTLNLTNPNLNRLRSVSFLNQEIGLISASDCAFRSTNGGISWIKMDPGTPGTDRPWLDCQMTSNMTGWLVGRDVMKTTNGGETWISMSMFPGEDMFWRFVFFLNSMNGWISGDSYCVRTTDGGDSWTLNERTGISDIFFANEFTGWMACSDGICKTTNSGDNWVIQTSDGASRLNFINENTGWTSNMKTTNGGNNWFVQSDATEITSIFFDSTLNGWRTGFGANRLYRSSDGGDNWINMNSGFRNGLNSCCFVSETSGWVAGESGIIYATSNGGTNWNLQPSGINSTLRSIFFTSPTDGWAGGTGNDLLKTTNAGSTWELQPNVSEDIYSIYFQTHSIGFIGAQGKILRTTNAGINWNIVYSNEDARVTSVLLNSSNTGWAVGRINVSTFEINGLILRSTDEGQSWSQINSPVATSISAVHFPSPSTGYIVANFGPASILKTTNAGDLWEVISYNVFMLIDPSSVHFFNNNTGWVSGNYGTVAKTTDGGFNWQTFFIGTDDYLKSMSFYNEMTGWVVGSEGTILKTTNAGTEPLRVDLKFFIEGLYRPGSSQVVQDTVKVFLREGSTPFNKIDSAITVFNVNGNYSLEFFRAQQGGQYYLSIEHKKTLETWSASRLEFNNSLQTIDFTINGAVAYGANQILVGNKYCFYSGDVVSDGIIDGSDLMLVDNDAFESRSGYLQTDVTGDNFTDASDIAIVDNNSLGNVMVRRP
ncbi:MAG: hypothetical protein IPG09_04435 [Ignavibacteria bacterium]|nr:hypothetical protein [Ignavibacteria bacterium]